MATVATHVWRPSGARVLTVDGFVPGPRGVPARAKAPPTWPAKDPADVLDYQFDIAPAFSGNDGDAIATLDVAISPAEAGGLSIASTAADGSRAVLWLQGGVAGRIYAVTLTLGTQAGRTLSRTVLLPVLALATDMAVVSVLTTDAGDVLTDANGNALLLGG